MKIRIKNRHVICQWVCETLVKLITIIIKIVTSIRRQLIVSNENSNTNDENSNNNNEMTDGSHIRTGLSDSSGWHDVLKGHGRAGG